MLSIFLRLVLSRAYTHSFTEALQCYLSGMTTSTPPFKAFSNTHA